ncbi:MAG TPA: copper-binding protein [Burkholderiales bacterium]|nr:copper-binding protein [Burkholderiales bacterium]
MKRSLACAITLALSAFMLPAYPQPPHQASGTVTKVEPEKNAVTVKHGPVESLKWPAMTMSFKVKDKKVLEKMKPGAKVDFTFEQSGKDYTITDVR